MPPVPMSRVYLGERPECGPAQATEVEVSVSSLHASFPHHSITDTVPPVLLLESLTLT